MTIIRHYSFCNKCFRCRTDPCLQELITQLSACGIKVTVNERDFSFDVAENSKYFDVALYVAEKAKMIEGTFEMILFTKKYSNTELENADYLHIRSVYVGISPLDEYRSSYTSFEHDEHFIQVGPPIIKKHPSCQLNRHFATDYDSATVHLFCSHTAKQIIEENQLTGAEFRDVLDLKTRQPASDVFQLFPQECADFLSPGRYYSPGHICKICGQRRINEQDGRAEMLLNKRQIPENVDFMQSPPVIGADAGYPYYVISNKAYRVLQDHHLTRGLVFESLRTVP